MLFFLHILIFLFEKSKKFSSMYQIYLSGKLSSSDDDAP